MNTNTNKEDVSNGVRGLSREMLWEVDTDGIYTYISLNCESITGFTPDEIIGKKHFFDLHPEEGRDAFKKAAFEVFERKEIFQELRNPIVRKDGEKIWVSTNGAPFMDENGRLAGYRGSDYDITDLIRMEAEVSLHGIRLKTLLEIHKMSGLPENEFLDFVNDAILNITQSQYSFIGLMNEDETVFTVNAWSKHVMESCAISNKPIDYPIKEAGLWGDVIRLRKPIIINDYKNHPGRKVQPEGHVPISRFLYVPVFDEGRIVLVAAVANKEEEYNESDVIAFTSVLDDVWNLLQRKRIQEQLTQSELKYRNIFEYAVVGIFQSTHDGRFIDVNPAFVKMLGYDSPEDLIAGIKDIATQYYVSPEERQRFIKILEEKGEAIGFETRVRRKDGSIIWVVTNTRAVKDDKGEIYYEGTVRDITEQKKAQEELRKAHKQLFDIIEYLPDATLVIDINRKVVAWNRAIEEMTGVLKEDILGKGDYIYSIPFYGERRPILIDLLFEDDAEIEKKYDFVHKVGNTFFVEVFIPGMYSGRGAYLWASASRLFDEEGRIVGAMESIRDITEWKDAEARLKDSEEKYRGIFENAVEGIFQTTPDGRFISLNNALAHMMGFDSPEHMIKTFTDIAKHHYVNPAERMRYRKILEEKGFVRGFEAQVYRKDGEKIWISISARAAYDKSGNLHHYEGTIVDITRRKEAEAEIQKAYQTTRTIIENAPFGVYVVNEEGFIEYANLPMSRISGIELEQFKSINVLNLPTYKSLGIADKIKDALKGTAFSTEPFEYNSYYGNKKTTRRYTGIPIEEAGRQKVVIFIEDLIELKKAEEELKKERETFFSILENSPVGVMVIGDRTKINYINPEFTQITGYDIEDISEGKYWFKHAYPDPEYRNYVIEQWKKDRLLGEQGKRLEFRVTCKNGEVRFLEFKTTHLKDGSSVTILTDVTDLRKAEMELKESEERFHSLFEGSHDAIYIANGRGVFLDVNQAFVEMFGYTKEETLRLNIKDAYISSEDIEKLRKEIKKNDFIKDYEIRLKKRDGALMDCLLTVTCKRDKNGKALVYQGIVRDITERKRNEEAIRYMAFHDTLTGLPNRALFSDRLIMSIAHGERFEEKVAVMMLDLDRFKEVNDTFGHSVGDKLLQAVAEKLIRQIRKGDTVARMGGDEFMLIFTDLKHTEDVNAIAEKILEDFQLPVVFDGRTLSITTSIGISVYPDHGADSDTLIKNADIAMYEVKQTGRNGYRFYVPKP